MTVYIAPIVEGETEAICVPTLLHKIWTELLCVPERLDVLAPLRAPRTQLVHPSGAVLSEKVSQSASRVRQKVARDRDIASRGLVLLLIDAESDCPAMLGPELSLKASAARKDVFVASVLATRMFENWILAGASYLPGINGMPDEIPVRDRFEECGGAAWLDLALQQVDRSRRYKKTSDAITFVQHMNLQECRENSLSFQTLLHRLESQLPPPPTSE